MIARSLLLLGATVLGATAAHASSITVLGTNADAIACYRAASKSAIAASRFSSRKFTIPRLT